MPNPKHKHSKTRTAKRRTHYKAVAPTITVDSVTGETHLMHRAHWFEGKLMYKGKVVMEKAGTSAEDLI
ncbi:MAG: 50S ribosomal protein L32 [Bacteroidia bacterium]|jgi:large subunit ribosomal protein L32|nr:50S ribosomal protein L32 [Bacteroidia bacterium]